MNRPPFACFAPAAAFLSTAVVAASLAPMVSAATLADALDAAPANAEVVVAFPSLQGFSGMVARLATAAGLSDEGTDDVLGTFKREFGLKDGVDDAGAGLLVITGLSNAMANQGGEPGALLLLPVTDYAGFVASLEKPVALEEMPEGVTAVMLDGQPSAVRQAGGYAVLGETTAEVIAYEAASAAAEALAEMGGYAAEAAGSPDVAVWVNVAAMRPGMNAAIDQMAEAMAGGALGDGSPLAGSIGQALAPLGASAMSGAAQSVDGLLLTARMTADHVEFGGSARVKPGSPVAAFFTDGRADPMSVLASAPDAPFITASVVDLVALDLAGMNAALVAAVREGAARFGAAAGDEDAGKLSNAIVVVVEAWAEMARPAEGGTALGRINYPSNPQAMMAGGVFQTLDVTAAIDPAAIRSALPAGFDAMKNRLAPAVNELMAQVNAMGAGDAPADPPRVSIASTVNADALTLAGTAVDQYQMTFALPPEMLESMGPAGFALGNAAVSGFAAATDSVYLQTTSADPAFMERAIRTAKGEAGASTLAAAASLDGVVEALPEGLVAVGLFSLQGVAEAVNPFVGMFLQGVDPLDVPAALPPVALGMGMKPAAGEAAGGHDVALRLNLPVPLIEFARDTYQDVAPRLGGGPGAEDGPGPGQGPPPAPF